MTLDVPSREITQVLVGLMLLFAALTLVPRALILLKVNRRARGAMYLALGGASVFLSIVAFAMALD